MRNGNHTHEDLQRVEKLCRKSAKGAEKLSLVWRKLHTAVGKM